MKSKKVLNTKKSLIILLILLLIGIIAFILILSFGNQDGNKNKILNDKEDEIITTSKQDNSTEIVDIIDINSKTRPIAISINNTPVAVKVQEGLNQAYLIYEIPTEGYTSRLLALYKDVLDLKVGTIRSARHNFPDFAFESDAILASFGWSHYAEDDLKAGSIDYVQGIVYEGNMWRENPENLSLEHTVYLNIGEVLKYAYEQKGYKKESNDTILLKYNVSDVDLSKNDKSSTANKVTVYYGDNTTVFNYDKSSKLYYKSTNGEENIDYATKEKINTKNIIIQKIDHSIASDNQYWNLYTSGTGDGYYITNGYSVPIKWSKESRSSKTKYTYLDGKEIEVSDGRTYIEVQILEKDTIIE